MRVFDIGKVLVVGDDGDRMCGSLEVLTPFLQGENYCKKFMIIDVVVALG